MCEFVFQLNSYAQISLSSTHNFSSFSAYPLSLHRHPRNATHQLARELIWVWNTRRNERAMCCMLCAKIFSNCCRSSRENFYTFWCQGNLLPSSLDSENSFFRHKQGTGEVCVRSVGWSVGLTSSCLHAGKLRWIIVLGGENESHFQTLLFSSCLICSAWCSPSGSLLIFALNLRPSTVGDKKSPSLWRQIKNIPRKLFSAVF